MGFNSGYKGLMGVTSSSINSRTVCYKTQTVSTVGLSVTRHRRYQQ